MDTNYYLDKDGPFTPYLGAVSKEKVKKTQKLFRSCNFFRKCTTMRTTCDRSGYLFNNNFFNKQWRLDVKKYETFWFLHVPDYIIEFFLKV